MASVVGARRERGPSALGAHASPQCHRHERGRGARDLMVARGHSRRDLTRAADDTVGSLAVPAPECEREVLKPGVQLDF